MLRFCAKHGITANKEAIWQLVQRFNRDVQAARKACPVLSTESESWKQSLIPFGKS